MGCCSDVCCELWQPQRSGRAPASCSRAAGGLCHGAGGGLRRCAHAASAAPPPRAAPCFCRLPVQAPAVVLRLPARHFLVSHVPRAGRLQQHPSEASLLCGCAPARCLPAGVYCSHSRTLHACRAPAAFKLAFLMHAPLPLPARHCRSCPCRCCCGCPQTSTERPQVVVVTHAPAPVYVYK
jgi:hypothetical protein